jgi:hypothetical protein
MNFDAITDIDIAELIKLEKKVKNPGSRWSESRGNKQRNYNVSGGDFLFSLYLRQNTYDEQHFSCGLSVIKPDGQKLTLLRYNGANHPHGDIKYACHIHRASERAIRERKKPEWYADETNLYHTLEGALFQLCKDANISGLANLKADEPDLFS